MNELIFKLILILHVTCGFTALSAAFCAMLFAKGKQKHRTAGHFFFYAMTGVFITAIPMSIVKSNLFLFLIALFSYYMAFSGWRYAKNRTGVAMHIDWAVAVLMLSISLVMMSIGVYNYKINFTQAIVLLVFGMIGGLFSLSDLKIFYTQRAVGKERIVKHLTAMLGATIAALTAFSVTNIPIQPPILLWLGPTILLVPVISWWNYRVLKNKISIQIPYQ